METKEKKYWIWESELKKYADVEGLALNAFLKKHSYYKRMEAGDYGDKKMYVYTSSDILNANKDIN